MKEIFTKSENFKQEYSATIVRVGHLKDIENSNNLKQAIIDGFSVVVNKNDVKEGDYMVYCKNETELNSNFLSINNMYELSERERNSNHEEVEKLMEEGNVDDAKKLVGYFNKNGRVKMIKLRGCPSMGVLMRLESLVNWDSELSDVNLSDYVKYDENGNFIPFDFDTINGKLFIKAYVPKTNVKQRGTGVGKKKDVAKKFDRMIEGEFAFHYDTSALNSNMWRFNPQMSVYVSDKLHGSSFVLGNILVKKPTIMNKLRDLVNSFKGRKIKKIEQKIEKVKKEMDLPWDMDNLAERCAVEYLKDEISGYEKRITKIENSKIRKFDTTYDNIYSSRTVIKNQYINKNAGSGYYSVDIWGEYNELLKGKIPQNITIYGEIVGYLTCSESMIQKDYDYGCEKGTNKLMIYRVNEKLSDGTHLEYEIDDVIEFSEMLVYHYPELKEKIMPYPLLYRGKLSDLYPEIATDNHWNENVLEAMKNDKEHFGMELDEPLCNNKVPREGICIRIENDPIKECFKLKTVNFFARESKAIDKGEVDMEMMDGFQN